MEITLKRLGYPAKNLKVAENTTVAEILSQVLSDCDIESERISLLFKGVPLSDRNRSLKDYSIKSGDKIMVVVKAPGKPTFEQVLQKYLQTDYNSADAQAITSKFMSLLSSTLDSLSLDDIDRLASSINRS
ncbi:unnamed protein product [Hymenolepis diminuta]|uniref:Ubiquitin-like domain-containing protein n=1 Tax=Hymenolepis diminuta TaxID=6216 RepID=A0A0R3SB45_HYMDI|nr:unnamed protein product [Hymenolepis diminuta]VUZ51541.1 unnamed protein product [Hymenolepis diminuta]